MTSFNRNNDNLPSTSEDGTVSGPQPVNIVACRRNLKFISCVTADMLKFLRFVQVPLGSYWLLLVLDGSQWIILAVQFQPFKYVVAFREYLYTPDYFGRVVAYMNIWSDNNDEIHDLIPYDRILRLDRDRVRSCPFKFHPEADVDKGYAYIMSIIYERSRDRYDPMMQGRMPRVGKAWYGLANPTAMPLYHHLVMPRPKVGATGIRYEARRGPTKKRNLRCSVCGRGPYDLLGLRRHVRVRCWELEPYTDKELVYECRMVKLVRKEATMSEWIGSSETVQSLVELTEGLTTTLTGLHGGLQSSAVIAKLDLLITELIKVLRARTKFDLFLALKTLVQLVGGDKMSVGVLLFRALGLGASSEEEEASEREEVAVSHGISTTNSVPSVAENNEVHGLMAKAKSVWSSISEYYDTALETQRTGYWEFQKSEEYSQSLGGREHKRLIEKQAGEPVDDMVDDTIEIESVVVPPQSVLTSNDSTEPEKPDVPEKSDTTTQEVIESESFDQLYSWFRNIDGTWNSTTSNPGFDHASKLISYLMAIGILGDRKELKLNFGTLELFSVRAKEEQVKASDLCTAVLGTASYLCQSGARAFEQKSIKPFFVDAEDQEFTELFTKIITAADNVKNMNWRVTGFTEASWQVSVDKCIAMCQSYRKVYGKTSRGTVYQQWLNKLEKIKNDYETMRAGMESRIMPFGIGFLGGSGIGKSHLTIPLAKYLLQRNGYPNTNEYFGVKGPDDAFDSLAHSATLCWIRDDVGTIPSTMEEKNYVSGIMNEFGIVPYAWLKAEAEDKGKCQANHVLQIMSTNLMDWGAMERASFPVAMLRRFHSVFVSLKPDYTMPDGSVNVDLIKELHGDDPYAPIHTFTVTKTVVKGDGQPAYAPLRWGEKLMKDIEIGEFIALMDNLFTRHLAKEKARLAKEETDLCKILCEHGKIPVSCEQCGKVEPEDKDPILPDVDQCTLVRPTTVHNSYKLGGPEGRLQPVMEMKEAIDEQRSLSISRMRREQNKAARRERGEGTSYYNEDREPEDRLGSFWPDDLPPIEPDQPKILKYAAAEHDDVDRHYVMGTMFEEEQNGEVRWDHVEFTTPQIYDFGGNVEFLVEFDPGHTLFDVELFRRERKKLGYVRKEAFSKKTWAWTKFFFGFDAGLVDLLWDGTPKAAKKAGQRFASSGWLTARDYWNSPWFRITAWVPDAWIDEQSGWPIFRKWFEYRTRYETKQDFKKMMKWVIKWSFVVGFMATLLYTLFVAVILSPAFIPLATISKRRRWFEYIPMRFVYKGAVAPPRIKRDLRKTAYDALNVGIQKLNKPLGFALTKLRIAKTAVFCNVGAKFGKACVSKASFVPDPVVEPIPEVGYLYTPRFMDSFYYTETLFSWSNFFWTWMMFTLLFFIAGMAYNLLTARKRVRRRILNDRDFIREYVKKDAKNDLVTGFVWLGGIFLVIGALYKLYTLATKKRQESQTKEDQDQPLTVRGLDRATKTDIWKSPAKCLEVKTDKSATMSAKQIYSLTRGNMVNITVPAEAFKDKKPMQFWGLGLKGNIVVVPMHGLPDKDANITVRRGGVKRTVTLYIKNIQRHPETETGYISLPELGTFKDLTGLMSESYIDDEMKVGSRILMDDQVVGGAMTWAGRIQYEDGTESLAYEYTREHYRELCDSSSFGFLVGSPDKAGEPGQCGMPVFAARKPFVLVGIHIGSDRNVKNYAAPITKKVLDGFSARIVKESKELTNPFAFPVPSTGHYHQVPFHQEIKFGPPEKAHWKNPVRWIEEADRGKFEILGTHDRAHAGSKQAMFESPAHKELTKVFGPTEHKIPPLRPDWLPFQKCLAKISKPSGGFEATALTKAFSYAVKQVTKIKDDEPRSVEQLRFLDHDETLNGIDGVLFVDRMEPNTSMGWPTCKAKTNFLIDTERKEEGITVVRDIPGLEESAAKRTAAYLDGENCNEPFMMAPKANEVLPHEKEAARVIFACPITLSYMTRKCFLLPARLVQMNWRKTGCVLGMNCYGDEWHEAIDWVTEFGEDSMIASDFSGFDTKQNPIICLMAWRLLILLFQLSGTLTDEMEKILWGIVSDIVFCVTVCQDVVLRTFGVQPSGQNLTTTINSLVNWLLHLYAFFVIYPDGDPYYVRFLFLGDDVLIGVNRKLYPRYNHKEIKKVFHSIGFKYTTDSKFSDADVEFRNLSDVSFLKRYPKKSPDHENRWVAALSESSILKSLYWLQKSKVMQPESILMQNFITAAFEWSLYGKEVFEDRMDKLETVAKEACVPFTRPTFKSQVDRWQEMRG